MFFHADEEGYTDVLPGITRKTLVYGGKTLMAEFCLKADSILPMHNHPHEQTGYLVSGRLELTINGESSVLVSGDAWCISPDVMHGAVTLEDSVAIEVFSPVRADYLPDDND